MINSILYNKMYNVSFHFLIIILIFKQFFNSFLCGIGVYQKGEISPFLINMILIKKKFF